MSSAFDTRAVHAGRDDAASGGAVVTPIYQSTTYDWNGGTNYDDIRYVRLSNNPNHLELHGKLAALEGAEAALVTASGMAAISTALLCALQPGEHLLILKGLYGGTHDLVTKSFPGLGIEVDFIDGDRPESWESLLRPTTRAIYFESLTNPLLEVPDLEAAVAFSRAHGLVSLIDNTFPSPFNYRPIEHGFDLSLHSATKYLNGHSDVLAGAIIGGAELVERARKHQNHFGATLDPHAAYLLCRGIKTLGVRMRHHNQSALQLAAFLEEHPAVARVNHPGLESHPRHERAQRLFDGTSGMLSFELHGGAAAAKHLVKAVAIPHLAPSLGGVESLITLPAGTSHSGLTPEERAASGITDGLVRYSVGLEDTRDLIADLERALESTP